MNGKYIKLILGSKVMNEGITLQNIKDIHVLDTWYTLGLLEQIIGRGIRDCKHYDLMTNDNFFPLVNIYKYVSSLKNSNIISKEEELYYKAEIKFLNVKEVERILIQNAIDCPLNYNVNKRNFEKKCKNLNDENSKLPLCPQECEFQSCIYQCNSKLLNYKYYDAKRNLYKIIDKNNIDNSTYNKENIQSEILYCILLIKNIFFRNNYITYQQIKTFILKNYPKHKHYFFDEYYILMALDILSPSTEEDFKYFTNYIYNIYNQKGYLKYKDNYFVYENFGNDINLLMYNNSISLSSFVNSYLLKKKNYSSNLDFTTNKSYYSKKKKFQYIGVLDQVFKLKSNYKDKGSECISSLKKNELMKIVKILHLDKNNLNIKNKKILCYHIEKTLLFLEKYNKENMTYVIIPNNHPIYIHPYNIYSRKKYLEKFLKISINIIHQKYFEFVSKITKDGHLQILQKYKFYLFDSKKNIWRSDI